MSGAVARTNWGEDFRALYAAMSYEDLLRLAAEGGLKPEAHAVFADELRERRITASAIRGERRRQKHAMLQIKVGRTPFSRYKGVGLRFRGKTFRSQEDEAHGISVQTRWFVMWWLSMVPLGSYRVREAPEDSRGYEIMSREPLEWQQVRLGLRRTAAVFVFLLLAAFWVLRYVRRT